MRTLSPESLELGEKYLINRGSVSMHVLYSFLNTGFPYFCAMFHHCWCLYLLVLLFIFLVMRISLSVWAVINIILSKTPLFLGTVDILCYPFFLIFSIIVRFRISIIKDFIWSQQQIINDLEQSMTIYVYLMFLFLFFLFLTVVLIVLKKCMTIIIGIEMYWPLIMYWPLYLK